MPRRGLRTGRRLGPLVLVRSLSNILFGRDASTFLFGASTGLAYFPVTTFCTVSRLGPSLTVGPTTSPTACFALVWLGAAGGLWRRRSFDGHTEKRPRRSQNKGRKVTSGPNSRQEKSTSKGEEVIVLWLFEHLRSFDH